jgi:hypothetical protein
MDLIAPRVTDRHRAAACDEVALRPGPPLGLFDDAEWTDAAVDLAGSARAPRHADAHT